MLSGVLIYIEYTSPRNKDWRETYNSAHKLPFGTYILHKQLPDLFTAISRNHQSFYQLFSKDSLRGASFLAITRTFDPGTESLEALRDYVERGNHAFIAARIFGKALMDTLDVKMDGNFRLRADSIGMRFTNPHLPDTSAFYFFRALPYNAFALKDSSNAEVIIEKTRQGAVMLKIRAGKGAFYLHSAPQCFTNYNLLKRDNHRYVSTALSYLPNGPVIWDSHYKPFRSAAQSPVRYILSVPPLTWAYYITIAGMLLLLLFKSKRIQRPIPVWEPPKNLSLGYIRTIAHLYFRYRNDYQLAVKKVRFWEEYLRSKYFTEPMAYTREEAGRIAQKTGAPVHLIQQIFDIAADLETSKQINQETLHKLNRRIERFYENTK